MRWKEQVDEMEMKNGDEGEERRRGGGGEGRGWQAKGVRQPGVIGGTRCTARQRGLSLPRISARDWSFPCRDQTLFQMNLDPGLTPVASEHDKGSDSNGFRDQHARVFF